MSVPDKPKESDTDRDGAFSYAAEWHAFTHGVYAGFKAIRPIAPEIPDNSDVRKEPHYFKGGYVVGTLLQVGILLVLITIGFG